MLSPSLNSRQLRDALEAAGVSVEDARQLASIARRAIGRRQVALVRDRERDALAETHGRDRGVIDGWLATLDRAGWMRRGDGDAAPARDHGARRRVKLEGLSGLLTRGLVHQLPTTTNTRLLGRQAKEGPIAQSVKTPWGSVESSATFSPDHLGIVAMCAGLWWQRTRKEGPGGREVDLGLGELAELMWGASRPQGTLGGKDLARVRELLADWIGVELRASVNSTRDGYSDPTLAIDGAPIEAVEVLSGGCYVPLQELDDRPIDRGEHSVRVRLSESFVATIEGDPSGERQPEAGERTRIWIGAQQWAHLRPMGRRVYALLQGRSTDPHSRKLVLRSGAKLNALLGIADKRAGVRECILTDAVMGIELADARYQRCDPAYYRRPEGMSFEEARHRRRYEFAVYVTVTYGRRSELEPACRGRKAPTRSRRRPDKRSCKALRIQEHERRSRPRSPARRRDDDHEPVQRLERGRADGERAPPLAA